MPTWLPVISNLAALFTAMAALFTVLEMRRQRSSSYKPDICVTPVPFHVYWDKPRDRIPSSWSIQSIDQPQANGSRGMVSLNCANVGFGAAKDVEGRWHYEMQEFITILAELDADGSIKCFIDRDGLLEIQAQSLNIYEAHLLKNQIHYKLGHIVPRSTPDRPVQLPLPQSYVRLCSIYLYLFLLVGSQQETRSNLIIETPPVPPLRLELHYRDIGNGRLTKTFVIKADFSRVNPKTDEVGWHEAARGMFSVEEEN